MWTLFLLVALAFGSEPAECSYIVEGYEIVNVGAHKNGMAENGERKSCYKDEEGCVRWCHANRAAGCVGVTSKVVNHKDFYFPVTTIGKSDRKAVEGGRITLMECGSLTPSLSPTKGNSSPTDTPDQTPCLPSDEPGSKISCDRILSDEEKQGFVDRHNHWRNLAALGTFNSKTKASQMPRVFWDSELAEHSKNYSRLCVWEHSGPHGFNNLDYGYGENLYASTHTGMTGAKLSNIGVDSWGLEWKDYNPIDNTCSKVCGHYTQVVWETSVRIGCGVTECSDIDGLSWGGTLVVCQYWPPGNYPTVPYTYASSTTGESCANGVHGGSTGMDSTWTALCNNENEICGEDSRCSLLVETCSSSEPLNGFNTSYACEPAGCSYRVEGYEIENLGSKQNGMTENGKWKYCWKDEEGCVRWCDANRAAGCVGVTSAYDRKGFYFPVTSIAKSDRKLVKGGRITLMECESFSPSLSPTEGTSSPPTDIPSFVPTKLTLTSLPSVIPSASPTNIPSFVPTKPTLTSLPSAIPSASPTDIPSFVPTKPTLTSLPSVIPSASPTNDPTLVSTTLRPSPAPTTEPTRSCIEKRKWTRETATDNCPARFSSKIFGSRACRSSHQDRLQVSLANRLYGSCRSNCVYDYKNIIANGKRAFLYNKRRKCYRYVRKGRCFKKRARRAMRRAKSRAKKLC